MFTAFFVLAQVSKKIKIGHDLYDLFRVPFKKLQKWVTKNQGKPDQ
jgi:hypothetical protein